MPLTNDDGLNSILEEFGFHPGYIEDEENNQKTFYSYKYAFVCICASNQKEYRVFNRGLCVLQSFSLAELEGYLSILTTLES